MAWQMENMGLASNPRDDPLVFKLAVWDDVGGRDETEQFVYVKIPSGATKTAARAMALEQVRVAVTDIVRDQNARALLPTGPIQIN